MKAKREILATVEKLTKAQKKSKIQIVQQAVAYITKLHNIMCSNFEKINTNHNKLR